MPRRALLLAVTLLIALGGCGATTGSPEAATSTASSSSTTSTTAPPPATSSTGATLPPSELPQPTPSMSKGTKVTLTGIPEAGVEHGCLLLQSYLLLGGDRALLGSGRAVTVTARTAPDTPTTCQQGVPVVVESVSAAG